MPRPCFTTAVLSNKSLGCCWCPEFPDNTLGNDPLLPTATLFVRMEVRWIGWRNNVGINISCFRNDPGHRRPHRWSFLSAARDSFGLLFAPSIVVSTLSKSVCRSNTSTPTHKWQPVPHIMSKPAAGNLRAYQQQKVAPLNFALQASAKSWVNTDFSYEWLLSVV